MKKKILIGKLIETSVILTPPGRPLHISQSDWNYHYVQFWHFQKIPAEELPQVSGEHSNTQENPQPLPTNVHTQISKGKPNAYQKKEKRENILARCIFITDFFV